MTTDENIGVTEQVFALDERVWFSTTTPVKRVLGMMARDKQSSIAHVVRTMVLESIQNDPVYKMAYMNMLFSKKE